VYDQGWRVLIAGGNFCPDALKDNLYVNIQYNTNPESTQRSISIGSYTNQKNYEDSPKYIIKPIAERESPSIDQTSPIASGSNFLDPGQDSDARLIQTQLAEKGYYTKNIDGDFGSGSKAALKNFKKDSGLDDDSTWDLKTQQILFKNSGL
jgi:peptidoglycan hydrolase-like protein with peptidoglycan-binding domain